MQLQKLDEIYPNEGESKKDFISRFMSVTKDEYPDVKQRYAVANSYWDRRNKKRVNETTSNVISSPFVIALYYTDNQDAKEELRIAEQHFDTLLFPYGITWSDIKFHFKPNNLCIISGKLYSDEVESIEELENEIRERLLLEDWEDVIDSVLYIKCLPINELKYYISEGFKLTLKQSLTEATRNQLIAKSKSGDSYVGQKANRWTAKSDCNIANTVEDYNKIEMNKFWKDDILSFDVKVKGKTGDYLVGVELADILPKIQRRIKQNNNKLDITSIYDGLLQGINSSDLKIDCTCPDYKYRLKYYASKNGYNKGAAETRASEKTNPNDSKGAVCKHILAVLNNVEWLRKIASVINNYINYCKDNMEYNYGKYIFPKLFGISYEDAVQMTIDDYDENGNPKDNLNSEESLINLSNALGKVRGRFKKGSNKNPASNK